MAPLEGKTALVTGASRGIGAAIAVRLAEDGADVALTYRVGRDAAEQVAKRIERAGRRALLIQADSADQSAVAAAVRHTAAELGGLDILVNNAGIGSIAPLSQLDDEVRDRTIAVHVTAAFTAAREAAAVMGEGGRIISIGSNLAERSLFPGTALYSMTKAALDGLTRGLARELGPRGITAATVHPGSTDTDMNPADGPGADAQRAASALGRYGTAEDVAAAVAFLAGPGGRSVSGSSILVDSGVNA
jgi:3-oxoacyl-[acyl-carrier protein] reductase